MTDKVEVTKLRTLKVHLKVSGRHVIETYKDVTKNLFFIQANGGKVYHVIETLADRVHIIESDDYNVIRVESTEQTEPNALTQVSDEMKRQVAKWGQQNHTSYTPQGLMEASGPITAELAKLICDLKSQAGAVSWTDIFLEEVFEAIEEAKNGNLENLRTELVQCAAVAVSWAESIDRNQK